MEYQFEDLLKDIQYALEERDFELAASYTIRLQDAIDGKQVEVLGGEDKQ